MNAANRASDVITRLRALFSKKGATAEPPDLNEAAREVIALSLSDLQRQRVVLQLEFADPLPPLKAIVFNASKSSSISSVTPQKR